MDLSSADKSFLIIAVRKGLLSDEEADDLESRLSLARPLDASVTLDDLARRFRVLDEMGIARILRTRERHGRDCRLCQRRTYLLPGQRSSVTPCEHCGGSLISARHASERLQRELAPGFAEQAAALNLEWLEEEEPVFAEESASPASQAAFDVLEQALDPGAVKLPEPMALPEPPAPVFEAAPAPARPESGSQLISLLLGARVDGYEVEAHLSSGGMGELFLAAHPILDRKLVVKTLKAEHAAHERRRQRFIREARSAARLDHPHIVPVLNVAELEDGTLYLTMPYIEGRDLEVLVLEDGPISEAAALELARDLGRALAHAHAQGITHRDIKPANILLDLEGHSRLTDFGLAKMESEQDALLTKPGAFVGTPLYMAPEAGASESDSRVDVYGLGLTLIFAVTGVHPFASVRMNDLLLTRAHRGLSDPRERAPQLSERFVGLLARSLRVDPDERTQSAERLADEAEALLAGVAIPGEETSWRVE